MKRALLMSSSRMGTMGYLEHAGEQIHRVLRHKPVEVLFIPYAAVSFSFSDFENIVQPVFQALGYSLRSVHHFANARQALAQAEAIAVGGGNTFALLKRLYDADLLSLLSQRVNNGSLPYIGWSAGSNIANPAIFTTNDMPVVMPPDFRALNIVPFQTNPHFIAGKPAGHNGESREERLNEFLIMNPGQRVLALYEGSALCIEDQQGVILGDKPALLFKQPGEMQPVLPDIPFLLTELTGDK